MALFDYRARIIPFVFTAPSGATFRLQYDKLDREGGKKSAVNEVLDSDASVVQDQGNSAERFPIDCYITGDNYDLIADGLYTALSERYSVTNSGLLIHPRWGALDVVPIKWKQSESFVAGQRRADFSIEFIRVYEEAGIFETIGLVVSQVVGLVDLLSSGELNNFVTNIPLAVHAIGDTLNSSIETVKGSIGNLISPHASERDTVNNIYLESGILLLDPASNSDLVVGQIQKILKVPMLFSDFTFSKINTYRSIIDNLIVGMSNKGDVSDSIKLNKLIAFERVAGYAVACQCAGALYTEFKTRSDAISAIEIIRETYELFVDSIESFKTESILIYSFSGDYDFLNILNSIFSKSIEIILNKSFDISSEARITLSDYSDPISLCYKYYGSVNNQYLDLFFDSNSIANNEFFELPPGREVVFYVG